MRTTVLLTTALLAGSILAAPAASAVAYSGSRCPAISIVGARATGEAPGMGQLLGPLATSIQGTTTSATLITALDYPASFDYANSLAAGTTALVKLLTNQVAQCPSVKIVVMGYSQGAQVVGNAFDGVGPQLSSTVKARVRAVELFGDPSFNGAEGYDRGSFTRGRSGIFARPAGAYTWAAGRTQSWCDDGDSYCQAGDQGNAHFTYGTHSATAKSYVLALLRS